MGATITAERVWNFICETLAGRKTHYLLMGEKRRESYLCGFFSFLVCFFSLRQHGGLSYNLYQKQKKIEPPFKKREWSMPSQIRLVKKKGPEAFRFTG